MIAAFFMAALTAPIDIAAADYAALPGDRQLVVRYVWLPEIEGQNLKAALALMLASASLEVDLRYQGLEPIGQGVYRIALDGLGWDPQVLAKVTADYPYDHVEHPLLIHGGWLLDQLADQTRSDAYYLLTFGQVPETLDEFWKLAKFDPSEVKAREYEFGLIETASGVAVGKTRQLEFYPTLGGYASSTFDFREIDNINSPFERLGQEPKQDAGEHIIGIPKSWAGGRGSLQLYALTNAADEIQNEAPADIAEDHSRFAGVATVRTPGSCITCHVSPGGLNAPSSNGLEQWIRAGIELSAGYDDKQAIERYHLSSPAVFLERASADYAAAVLQVTGLGVAEAAEVFNQAARWYRRDVTFVDAATELHVTPEDLTAAIALASDKDFLTKGHAVALAHQIAIPRAAFEDLYLQLADVVKLWRAANGEGEDHEVVEVSLPVEPGGDDDTDDGDGDRSADNSPGSRDQIPSRVIRSGTSYRRFGR